MIGLPQQWTRRITDITLVTSTTNLLSSYSYNINDPQLDIDFSYFALSDETCEDISWSYTTELFDYPSPGTSVANPFITVTMDVALNTGRISIYFTTNTYVSQNTRFVTLKGVVNAPDDLFIATQNFDISINDCLLATLSVDSPGITRSYIVDHVSPKDSWLTTSFTSSILNCLVKYEVYLWTDTNADTIQDSNEFSLIPTT